MVFKFIKRQVRTVGFRRFSFAASLILAGLVWKFVQLGGGSVEVAAKKALSFWHDWRSGQAERNCRTEKEV